MQSKPELDDLELWPSQHLQITRIVSILDQSRIFSFSFSNLTNPFHFGISGL